MTGDADMCELPPVTGEKVILAILPRNDELEVRTRPQMAAHLEKHDVIELVVTGTAGLPQILELHGVLAVGEKTATTPPAARNP